MGYLLQCCERYGTYRGGSSQRGKNSPRLAEHCNIHKSYITGAALRGHMGLNV